MTTIRQYSNIINISVKWMFLKVGALKDNIVLGKLFIGYTVLVWANTGDWD